VADELARGELRELRLDMGRLRLTYELVFGPHADQLPLAASFLEFMRCRLNAGAV
jgi:hypothetical protein